MRPGCDGVVNFGESRLEVNRRAVDVTVVYPQDFLEDIVIVPVESVWLIGAMLERDSPQGLTFGEIYFSPRGSLIGV